MTLADVCIYGNFFHLLCSLARNLPPQQFGLGQLPNPFSPSMSGWFGQLQCSEVDQDVSLGEHLTFRAPFPWVFRKRFQAGSDTLRQILWPHFPLWYMPNFGLAPTIPQPPGNSRAVENAQISSALPGHLILTSSFRHLLSSCFQATRLQSLSVCPGWWWKAGADFPSAVTSRLR